MTEGLAAAASGLTAAQARLDALSDDLVNADTPGYRPERVAFHDLLYRHATSGAAAGVTVGAGVAATSMGQSADADVATQQTGRALDVAIQGQGFLQVTRPDGTAALTRVGSLDVDPQGRLITSTGDVVQPSVTIPRSITVDQLTIGGDGRISANGRVLGQLSLVTVRAPEALQPLGGGDYGSTAASGAPQALATAPSFESGALEGSGVDLAQAMSQMTESERAYELASRAVQMQDQMMQIANEVKR